MVTDATVPSLVLLAVLAVAVVGSRLVEAALRRHRRRPARPAALPVPLVSLRLPRVVLLDDDVRTPVAA